MSLRDIAKEIGCSHSGIDLSLRGGQRAPRPDPWIPRAGHLVASEREEIFLGLHKDLSMAAIARELDRPTSTVSRQVKANGGRDAYRVWPAHLRAQKHTLRPKHSKLDSQVLCEKVTLWLKELWSLRRDCQQAEVGLSW